MKKDIRAVYFDLDDTLCAYWAASRSGLRSAFDEAELECGSDKAVEAWRRVFKTFSPEVKTEAWYGKYLESGEPTRTEHMRRMLKEVGCYSEGLAANLSSRYAKLRDENLTLFPEAVEVLEFLKPRYHLGLITNGPADVQRQEIVTLGLEQYFDHVLIEGEFKIGKPNVEIFREATTKWELQPTQMLFVGNAFEHDVQGAKKAGWWALWVNKDEEINPGGEPQPDAVIRDLWQVVDWLGIERPPHARGLTFEREAVRNWRG